MDTWPAVSYDKFLAAGEQVRAASKDPAATHLPTGVDVVDAGMQALALDGVDRMFLYADPQGLAAFLAKAREAGAPRGPPVGRPAQNWLFCNCSFKISITELEFLKRNIYI